jgi:hypothetical protein
MMSMPDLTLGSGSGQPRDQWRDIPQHLEYKAAKEVLSLVFPFLLLCLFSPPFFRREEDVGKVMASMQADTGVHKGTRLFSGPRGVKAEAARPRTLAEYNQVQCIHLHAPPTPRIPHPL